MTEEFLQIYEKHVLLESSQIYYLIYKCTCHYYTNMIKIGLIKIIKIRNLFTKCGRD
jgi:hypothetical protein